MIRPKRMPHLDRWQRMLAKRRGAPEAAAFAKRMQARYDALPIDQTNVVTREQRHQLTHKILPGVALYQVLGKEIHGQEALLAEMEPFFSSSFASMRRWIPFLRYLHDPFTAIRHTLRWQLRSYAPQEWEIVEDNDDCFAFNVRDCFTFDTLDAFGASELTRLYCRVDDWLNEGLPPSITWARTTTIGRGGDHCDFRWHRTQRSERGDRHG